MGDRSSIQERDRFTRSKKSKHHNVQNTEDSVPRKKRVPYPEDEFGSLTRQEIKSLLKRESTPHVDDQIAAMQQSKREDFSY